MIPAMLTIIPLFFTLSDIGLGQGMTPLILLYIASGIPFNTFVLRGFLESLPSELEEAATVDGASPFRVFWQIMLPLAWPGLVSTFLINFLSLWNEFFLALIFLRQGNATLPLGLFYIAADSAAATWQTRACCSGRPLRPAPEQRRPHFDPGRTEEPARVGSAFFCAAEVHSMGKAAGEIGMSHQLQISDALGELLSLGSLRLGD